VIKVTGQSFDDGERPAPAPGAGQGGCSLLDIVFAAGDLAKLRQLVADHCLASGLCSTRSDDFVLAVHEVMGNAIVHAGGSGRLLLERIPGALRCTVRDTGPGVPPGAIPPQPPKAQDAETGRGLWLAIQLADQLDIASGQDGTAAVLLMRLPSTDISASH